jgi:hypothetical protein
MTIKISELDNITAVTDATLLPVVDSVVGTLTTLKSNGAILKSYITSELNSSVNNLFANAGALQTQITSVANSGILANTNMQNYVDGQISAVNVSVVSANVGMKGYVDQANTIQTTVINDANLGMKGYVDSINSVLTANAAVQQGNIDLLRSDFTNYSPNAAVSSYLIANPATLDQGGTGQALDPVAGAVMFTSNSAINLTSPGTSGQVLTSNGNADPTFESVTSAVGFIIDGGGAIYSNGLKGYIQVPFDCVIQQVTLLADQVGSTVVDIWRAPFESYPPTVANSICASAKPTITSNIKSIDSTLTGWSKTINAGDVLAFNADSVTSITRVTITLNVNRT